MRLYLSSFRMGCSADRLLALVPTNRRALVIANACDLFDPEERATKVALEYSILEKAGFWADELDLRSYFSHGKSEEMLASLIADYGLIWVRGGNPFVLRRAMKSSGLDMVLHSFLQEDRIAYGGYSAGIAMLTPSLKGIEFVDDPAVVPQGYDLVPIWECLKILPFHLAPHYHSDHPESEAINRTVQYFIDAHIPFVALRDGEVMVVDGDFLEVLPARATR